MPTPLSCHREPDLSFVEQTARTIAAHMLGRKSVDMKDAASGGYDAILISTDHDKIDYAALAGLGIPLIDTRNAIASRGLPMGNGTKAWRLRLVRRAMPL